MTTSSLPPWFPFRRYLTQLTDGLDQHFFVAAFCFVGVLFVTVSMLVFGRGKAALSTIAEDVQSLTLVTAYWWGVLYFATGRKRDTLKELRQENPIAFAVVIFGILLIGGLALHH